MNILSSVMYTKCTQRSIMCLTTNLNAESRKFTGFDHWSKKWQQNKMMTPNTQTSGKLGNLLHIEYIELIITDLKDQQNR